MATQGSIDLAIPFQLGGLQGENRQLTHIVLEDLDGIQKIVEADYLLPFFGLSMNLGPIASGLSFG
jgi:thioredoxin reductase (NADPH)